jgi:hypothetical protein
MDSQVRRLLAFLVVVVVSRASSVGPLSQLAAAHAVDGAYGYDVLTNSRAGAHVFDGAGASPAQLSGSREGSAVPSAEVRGTSTTPSLAVIATNSVTRLGSVADDLAAARSHLGSIDDALSFGPNQAMLSSIDDAVAAGRPLTSAERGFLDHELL